MDDVMDRTVRRVQIGGTPYHLLKNRTNFIEDVERSEDKDYIPIFVYSVTAHEHITYNGLQSFFETCIKSDDVTNPCFLRNFYFLIYDMLEIALDANIIAFLEGADIQKLTRSTTGLYCMFDVPAFFARDLSRFEPFAELWYGANLPVEEKVAKNQHSSTILVPSEYFPTSSPAQSAVIEKFIIMLEQALKTERTSISLRTEWKRNLPNGVAETDPAIYLGEAGTLPYYRESYERLEQFRTDYRKTFHKDPFVHKALRWRWDTARSVTDDQRNDFLHRLAVYQNWLLEHVLQASSSPDSVFVVLPIEDGKPSYRDTSPPGFNPLYMSTITGAPEITLPGKYMIHDMEPLLILKTVGEVWCHSKITQREEPLPVSVSLLSSPGSGLALIQAAMQAFKQGGKSTILATGRSIYKHGDTQ
ncbi:hypothetical protein B9Z65_4716 [Elsinoe australis]|uniref:Uncharacterized protein n=1 Tax=Elsinoe australis TaxID=40998 RepID=A0A2P8A5V3_9PEZI|nr:hypothetical protein B9Z65_4716 [Elsinoe australis]